MKRVFLSTLCAAMGFVAMAQSVADSAVTSLDEVAVVARMLPSSTQSSTPLQSFTYDWIRKHGVLDVADAVRHMVGVQLRDYGGIGGLKTISLRGMGTQHTGVSYDGVSLGDCQSGQIDVSRFSVDNLSLLYLTIGQEDDIYQSARALSSAGVLHIETANPRIRQLSARAMVGSFGTLQASLYGSGRVSQRMALSGYVNGLRADGNYRFKMMNGTREINEKRNNSDVKAIRGEGNLALDFNEKQQLNAKLYFYDAERGLPGSVVYDNTFAAERLRERNFFAQLAYDNRFSDVLRFKSALKWNYSWMRDKQVKPAETIYDTFRQQELYATATALVQPTAAWQLAVAQDLQHNFLSTTLVNCPYPTRNSSLTSVASRFHTDRFAVTASLLYTAVKERVRTGEARSPFHRLSPALSLSWQPFTENLRVRLSYKDIFRMPTLNDLYYIIIGNTNLKPEKSQQINAGLTFHKRNAARELDITLSADAYYGKVKDKIVAVPTLFVWKMQNLGRVEMLGADFTATVRKQFARDWAAEMLCTYYFLSAKDKTDSDGATYGHQIAYTPKNATTTSVTVENPFVNVAYNLVVTGCRYSLNYNAQENHIPTIIDHSVSLWRNFSLKRGTLRAQLDLRNLAGRNYEVVRFYPMAGRHFLISLQYQLQ